MKKNMIIEVIVGLFVLSATIVLFSLAFKVSGFDDFSNKKNAIAVKAIFNEIADLKVRSPVKIAGVKIGEVTSINLKTKNYRAEVTMLIGKEYLMPNDSSASILSASLLGANYININPGFSEEYLKNGDIITETNPAVMIQDLIGQAIFTPKK